MEVKTAGDSGASVENRADSGGLCGDSAEDLGMAGGWRSAVRDLLFFVEWMVDNPGECLADHGNIERQAIEVLDRIKGR